MDANLQRNYKSRAKRVLKNLEKNNFSASFVDTKEEALTLVKSLIDKDSITAVGGSATLNECGITEFLKNETNFKPDYMDAYSADFYLSSANAITEHGEIYQVDGRSNRISAISFGPKKVILVVGMNKVVRTLRNAVERVKEIAAPANTVRLCKDTPCAKAGICVNPSCSADSLMAMGCDSDDRICCNTLIMSKQRDKDRVIVILVGEDCGY